MVNKKEIPMINLAAVPLPRPVEKKSIQADVSMQLFLAVKTEAKERRIKMTELVEWALKSFLVQTNPKRAKELGINVGK